MEIFTSEDGVKSLPVLLLVKEQFKEESIHKLTIYNNDAINFKRKVSKGDLLFISAQPYRTPFKNGGKGYTSGHRIQTYKIVKKKELGDD